MSWASQLFSTIASAIWKMSHSKTHSVAFDFPRRSFIEMDANSWRWIKSPFCSSLSHLGLRYHEMPSINATRFILLEDRRKGRDGKVWLACTTEGQVCFIKFPCDDDDDDLDTKRERLEVCLICLYFSWLILLSI